MTGRISSIPIKSWSAEELAFIPDTGFKLLNLKIDTRTRTSLAEQSIGSPHLMQEFCRSVAKIMKLTQEESPVSFGMTDIGLELVYKDVAESIGRPIFEKLARGPRQRADRVPRQLKNGITVDIYQLVLHALAHIQPGLVTIDYEELRSAIKEVIASRPPQFNEVVRVLKHMATIAASDESSSPVIEFEEEEEKLHITDPFFAFYLRWGKLVDPEAQQGE